jgi:predicted aminopeptidase
MRKRQGRQVTPVKDALSRLKALYAGLDAPRTPEQLAAADAACHGPLQQRQRELDLKGRE